jgi:hypothetical protein
VGGVLSGFVDRPRRRASPPDLTEVTDGGRGMSAEFRFVSARLTLAAFVAVVRGIATTGLK